jgi:hypothetical protein
MRYAPGLGDDEYDDAQLVLQLGGEPVDVWRALTYVAHLDRLELLDRLEAASRLEQEARAHVRHLLREVGESKVDPEEGPWRDVGAVLFTTTAAGAIRQGLSAQAAEQRARRAMGAAHPS